MDKLLLDLSSISDLVYYDQNYIDFCLKYFKNENVDLINTNKFEIITLYEFLSHKEIFKNISNHPKLFHSDETDAQMYMFNYKNTCTFGFRGTDSLKDILIDLAMWREVFSEVSDEILVHSGIYSQFKSLKKYIDENIFGTNIIVTGHSLGGGIATLVSLYLAKKGYTVSCYTYGSPRVGNSQFCKLFNSSNITSVRIVNDMDPVPSLPWAIRFQHVDGIVWLDNDKIHKIRRRVPFFKYFKRFFYSLFGFGNRISNDHGCPKYMYEIHELGFCNN